MEDKSHKWLGKDSAYLETIKYLDGRRKGVIKSIKTPWPRFNNAGVSGWEWNFCIVVCARPAGAKSLWKDQFVREAFDLNPDINFRILEFELEMVPRVSIIREFCSATEKSYKFLCNAETDSWGRNVTVEDLKLCYQYSQDKLNKTKSDKGNRVNVVYDPPTVEEFEKTISEYMEDHKQEDGSYTPTIITLDHARKIRRGSDTETEMLYKLGGVVNALKIKYPLIFIILNHLLREVDKATRNEEGTYGNYIVPSDVFGGDSLQQNADILVGFNIPAKQSLKYYGPRRLIMEEDTLVAHFLKVRNGDEGMAFYKLEGHKMQLTEIEAPPTAIKKSDFRNTKTESNSQTKANL